MSDFLSVNRIAFEENGIGHLLDEKRENLLYELCRYMQKKNAEMNVTSITDDDGIARKHFCDCAFLSDLIAKDAKVADIGCGGGFPCLPLAIFREDVRITAVDSTAKKIKYVEDTANELGLANVECVSMRAEEGAHDLNFRESYDAVCARAVASLDILCELCIPYLKIGGSFFAMKGRGGLEELEAAKKAIVTLGAELLCVHEFSLVCDSEIQSRYVIEIKKVSHTAEQYPRQYSKIKKKPL